MNWSAFPGLITNLYRTYVWRRVPRLAVALQCTGGGTGVDFAAIVSETGNIVPAMNVELTADLEGVTEPVFRTSFNLTAGELDRVVQFKLERPKYGTLVQACNHAATLYGKTLRVTVRSGRQKAAAEWREESYDPVTDRARYEAMQEVWREHTEGGPKDSEHREPSPPEPSIMAGLWKKIF